MAATCFFLVVQMLPLGTVLPQLTPVPLTDGAVHPDTLSIAPAMTGLMLTRQLTYCLLFFLVLQVSVKDARRALLLDLLLLAILTYAAYGEISLQAGDLILGAPKWAYPGSATGPFVNRNSFATFLAFGSVIAAARMGGLLVRQSQRHVDDGPIQGNASRFILYGLAYTFLLAIIVATQSRMGLFSALVGAAAVLALTAIRVRRRRTLLWMAAGLVAAALVGAGLFGRNLFDRLEFLGGSVDVRPALFAQTRELIALRPWTGFGGGSYQLAYPLVHDRPVPLDLVWDRAHNTYLSLWSELGLVFGTLPMLALAAMALLLLRSLLARRGSFTAQSAALGVLIVGAVHSTTDFSLEIEANTFIYLTVIAAGLASAISARRERPA
jgi:O-antigen ligase